MKSPSVKPTDLFRPLTLITGPEPTEARKAMPKRNEVLNADKVEFNPAMDTVPRCWATTKLSVKEAVAETLFGSKKPVVLNVPSVKELPESQLMPGAGLAPMSPGLGI